MSDKFFKESSVNNQPGFSKSPTWDFGFRATSMIIIIDSNSANDWIEFSFDAGNSLHGKVIAEDRHIVFDWFDGQKIWLRGPSGRNVNYRIYAWEAQK